MSRGVEHSTVTVHAQGGTLHVPVVVAWVLCDCGESVVGIASDPDHAAAALSRAEDFDGWRDDTCPDCARGSR